MSALLPPVQENYKLLFERSAGEFVAMAARPGEFAYHFDEERNGGFFTYAFLAALKDIQSWGEGQIRLNKSITVNDGSDGTAPVYQNPLVKWREEPPNTDRGGDNVQEALVVPPRIPAERRLVPTTTNLCGKLISFEKYDSSPSGGFEGVWTGRWDGVGSGICGAFIVESTSADGKAKIIYSYAGSTGVQGEFRQSASVNGDTLEFTERDDGHYRFVLNGNRLFAYFTSSKGRSLRTEFFRQ